MPHEEKHNASFENRLSVISKQAGIMFLEKIGSQFIMFASSILLARMLGTTLLGRYQLGLVVVQLLSVLTVMGFDRGLIRFIPIYYLKESGKVKKILFDSVLISLSLSIIIAILLYLSSPYISIKYFHSADMIKVFRAFSIYLPIYSLMIIGTSSFNGFKRSDIFSHITNIFIPVTFVILLSILLLTGGELFHVIAVRIISIVAATGAVIYFMIKNFSDVFKNKSVPYGLRSYLNYSFPLLAIGFLYYFIGRVDILMLGYFLESEQVGIYSVVVNISTLCIFGLHAVNKIFSPNISELYILGDFKSLESLLKALTKWIFYLSFFLFTYIVIYNAELLSLFGSSFIVGGSALVILAFGQLINSLAGSTGAILLMTGKQNWEVFNSISIIVLNVLLNYILIPRFGIEGAALSTAIAVSAINLLKVLETYKEFRIHPYSSHFFKGIFAIVVGAFPLYASKLFFNYIGLHFIFILSISIVLYIIIFSTIIHFLKYDEEDKLILNKIARKFNLKSIS